jgi:hypothetical protein
MDVVGVLGGVCLGRLASWGSSVLGVFGDLGIVGLGRRWRLGCRRSQASLASWASVFGVFGVLGASFLDVLCVLRGVGLGRRRCFASCMASVLGVLSGVGLGHLWCLRRR